MTVDRKKSVWCSRSLEGLNLLEATQAKRFELWLDRAYDANELFRFN